MRETVPWPRATHRATHAFFVLSVNLPRAWYLDIRTLTHEPFVKLKAILSRKQTQAEVNQSYNVFVQKERRWIISSSLIRIGIIAHDSSLLGLRFTGFGISFLDFMVNVECQRTASTTSILSMQVPENAIQMAC